MVETEVIIVGGGPAGSTCAWQLRRAGIDCLVLDREAFPRLKLCAGWLTPEVLDDLELAPEAYPLGLLRFERLRMRFYRAGFTLRTRQYSIRRVEFDAWLLQRSGAPVETHEVKAIREDGDGYTIDGRFRCRYLVGAGGTRCPVYRQLFRPHAPREDPLQVVTQELEFECPWEDERCHLWFFEKRLPGYAWYLPKANGYLNIGVGGMAGRLKARADHIKSHWAHLRETLAKAGLVRGDIPAPGGYAYYLRGRADIGRRGNAFVIGDAAGLATSDLGEGIGAAVRSGRLAADAIARGTPYSLDGVRRYSVPQLIRRR